MTPAVDQEDVDLDPKDREIAALHDALEKAREEIREARAERDAERDAARALLEKAREELEEWRETWTDDRGVEWRRPTAWAYAQLCRVRQELQAAQPASEAPESRSHDVTNDGTEDR